MKQIFYKGLLALTIAFGFTSCDKNDVGSENLQMTQSEVKAGLASKVTFSENGVGISVPKLKGSESSKTHSEFTHIYSPARQVLSIVNAGNVEQYTGSYPANDISQINPTSILLENGVGYVATSSNVSNTGLGVVAPFLPYTSTVGFNLSESGMITLVATLERGFLIVNGAAEALAGNRISGVTAEGVALIRDNDGDFYGYLSAGVHEIIISYTRDGASATTVDSIDVVIGTAYTVETGLLDESPALVGSDVSTMTAMALESEIGTEGTGRDINDDGDVFDSLERIITTTTPTLDGVPSGVAVVDTPAWSVVSDLDVDVDVSDEESTEAIYLSSVNDDSDLFDTITRIVTTTTTSVNDVVTDTDIDNGDWTILADHSSLTVGQSGTGTGAPVDADADGFNADVDLNDNDDTIGDQAAEDAKAIAAQAELDRIEAARVEAERVEAERLAEEARVEAERVAEEAAAALLAATPDTWTLSLSNQGGAESDTTEGTSVTEYGYDGTFYDTVEEAQAAASAANAGVDITVQIVTRVTTPNSQNYDNTYDVEIYTVIGDQDGSILNGATRNVNSQPKASTALTAGVASSSADFIIANAPIDNGPSFDAKDSDQDGDIDQADATAADFIATATGAPAGWNLTYSAASGVTSVLVSSQTINAYFFSVSLDPSEYAIVVDASRAQAYADAQVLAAYIAS